MTVKKIIQNIHLWLGLTSGLLVFVIAITGCLYAFKDEIQQATQSFRWVEVQNQPFLPPSVLLPIAQATLPDKHLHAIQYNGRNQSATAIFYHYAPTYYYNVFLNPYNGQVLRVKNMETGFFHTVLDGHFYLWLPPEIGQPIVASATLIFVVMLITGWILWFPKNKAAARQRFWFRWKSTTLWRRKNYDLHNILGFYVSVFALILAITGLVWGFPWFAQGWYRCAGGQKSLVYEDPIVAPTASSADMTTTALDRVWQDMHRWYPTASSIEVHPPETDSSVIAANANLSSGTYWKTDYRYFHPVTLAEIPVQHVYGRLSDATPADHLLRMNYDIHVGAIGGLPGKIIVFLASLVIAALPVTGIGIWWGRTLSKPSNTIKAKPIAAGISYAAPRGVE